MVDSCGRGRSTGYCPSGSGIGVASGLFLALHISAGAIRYNNANKYTM